MKIIKSVLWLILLITTIVNAQHKVSKTTGLENNKPQKKVSVNFNLSKRINSYPFNKASQIKIIS